jgi:signal peptidase II
MIILLFTVLIVLLDQAAKLAIQSRFQLHESRDVLGSVLRWTYVQNPGIAFGIDIGNRTFLTIFIVMASAAILIYLYRMRLTRFAHRFSLALILGGAIGNLIDRFAYGRVIDFIDLGIGNRRWPFVFNIADVAVTIGIVILIWRILFAKDTKNHPRYLQRRM